MNHSMRDLGQQYLAAAWDSASALPADPHAAGEKLGGLVESISEVVSQLEGLKLHLLHEAQLAAADVVADQVRNTVRSTPGQARGALRLAEDLGERFGLIAGALNEGVISLAQAEAIVTGLKKLPTRYTKAELRTCQETILEYADSLGPTELRTLATHLAEVIDPERADRDDAKRLADDDRDAHRARSFTMSPDYHGSVRLSGLLPIADAALLEAQLDALILPTSTYTEAGEHPTRGARRADALVLLVQHAANAGNVPSRRADRPRVHITLSLDALKTGLGHVGLLGAADVDGISASDARRLACDANLIPIVLDDHSRPLDVGREHRLFTPAIRAALVERDQGCAFPGCTVTPAGCEAHHILPWVQNGDTTLDNALLVCPFHHRLVEPDPLQSPESQWQVHLDETTGMPWFTPPRYIRPDRKPRQHRRHRLQQLRRDGITAPPCPDATAPPGTPRAAPPCPPDARPAQIMQQDRRRDPNPWHPEAATAPDPWAQ